MTLYVAMVEHESDEDSFLQMFWVEAGHIGAALDRVAVLLPIAGVPEPWFITEIDPCRSEMPSNAEALAADAWYAETRHQYPAEYAFRLPAGIIKSNVDGDHELADIIPGFSVSEEGPSIVIEAVVAAAEVLDTYLSLVESLGRFKVSWVKMQPDWEEGGEIAYVNESLNNASLMRALLERKDLDLVRNGHVTITAFAHEGSTNVSLTDHKTIEIWSTSHDLCNRVSRVLQRRGLPRSERLISIEHGFHHWHYRPDAAPDRAGLIAALTADGFRSWQPKPLADSQNG